MHRNKKNIQKTQPLDYWWLSFILYVFITLWWANSTYNYVEQTVHKSANASYDLIEWVVAKVHCNALHSCCANELNTLAEYRHKSKKSLHLFLGHFFSFFSFPLTRSILLCSHFPLQHLLKMFAWIFTSCAIDKEMEEMENEMKENSPPQRSSISCSWTSPIFITLGNVLSRKNNKQTNDKV